MKTRLIYDRRKTATKTKKGQITIEIYENGKRKWISAGISVFPDQWDEKRWVVNHIQSKTINQKLVQLLEDVERAGWSGATMAENGRKVSFLAYFEERISKRSDIRESTRVQHYIVYRKIEEFGALVNFSDLTRQNIKQLDEWLHTMGYMQSNIHKYHKTLRTYIREAIRDELIQKDPYNSIKIDRGQTDNIKYLTKEELKLVEDKEIANKSMRAVRDIFLFQCYTGLAYADMESFDPTKIEDRAGRKLYQATRVKTSQRYSVVLLPKALEILERYGYVLPIISNQKYNARLKILSKVCEIKPLTSHMGRHTFAVQALSRGVRIEMLAKMMGHTDIKTTQIYAKILGEDVVSEFDKLI